MSYVQRSVHSFFHRDLLSFYGVFDQGEFAVINDGEIVPQRTLISNAENLVEFSHGQHGLVYIGCRYNLYFESSVVRWKIFYQEFVC